ncbi:hypothetical protein L3N51_02472 [Metallosphaera sp. J1]|nr:hypothetical protein [Metallosphaera javensis (ex Hofmann et al. 2022)]
MTCTLSSLLNLSRTWRVMSTFVEKFRSCPTALAISATFLATYASTWTKYTSPVTRSLTVTTRSWIAGMKVPFTLE